MQARTVHLKGNLICVNTLILFTVTKNICNVVISFLILFLSLSFFLLFLLLHCLKPDIKEHFIKTGASAEARFYLRLTTSPASFDGAGVQSKLTPWFISHLFCSNSAHSSGEAKQIYLHYTFNTQSALQIIQVRAQDRSQKKKQ